MTALVKCLPGKLIRDSTPKVFYWGFCHVSTVYLALTKQESRFPKGKLVFSINHFVCLNRLGAVSCPYDSEVVGTLLKSKFPDTKPMANFVGRLF